MARTDVISSCVVRMKSNETPMSRMELTPWDLRFLLLDPIQKGILFHNPESKQTLIQHLKNSLSRTLDFFPLLAGRLGTVGNGGDGDKICYFIDCNNAGVQFRHATAASVSISDILGPTYVPEIVSSFFPLNGIPNREGVSKPLLGVQVTELVDGLFIASTANHTIADGTSFWHFFNSWAEISCGFDTISKTPVFERWFPSNVPSDNRLIPLPPLKQNQLQNFAPPPLLERVFHFSRESVAKLKAKANEEAGTDKISTLQALSAHLWRSTVRCGRHADDESSRECRLMMATGVRARIPLPEGYFGNAAYGGRTAVSEEELLQKGLGYVALKISDFVAQKTKDEVIKFIQDWVDNPILHTKASYSFFITSSPRFNVYGCDFGWGKPIAVRSGKGQKFDGKVTVFPTADGGGGIDAEVSLAPEVLQAMEKDAEFMEAFTT